MIDQQIQPVLSLRKTILLISLATVLSLVITFAVGFILWLWGDHPTWLAVLLLVFAWVGSYLIPVFVAGFSIRKAFAPGYGDRRLWVILVSYFSLILTFSCLYFSLALTKDHDEQVHKLLHYKYGCLRLNSGFIQTLPPWQTSSRAFSGIEPLLWWWNGEPPPDLTFSHEKDDALRQLMKDTSSTEVHINWENVPLVFFDCFHLSVVTMTTLGYGDISPKTRCAKLVTDMQVLSGQILVVVALGMFFANKLK